MGSRAFSNDSSAAVDPEVTFISGVDSVGVVAATSFGTWSAGSAGNYSQTSSWTTKWGSSAPGTPGGTVTYYFDPASDWTATEQAGLASGLALWSDEVDIHFVQTSDPAQADFTFYRGTDGGSYQQFPNETISTIGSQTEGSPGAAAKISIDTTVGGFGDIGGAFSYYGGYAYETLVHEEGHMLGLGHAGPYNGSVDPATQQFSAYDTRLWSLMSYIDPGDTTAAYYASYPVKGADWNGGVPTTPQILDILAAQRLYGAATSGPLAAGHVTFGFHCSLTDGAARYFDFTVNTDPVVTLWAAGSTNTLDVSGFSQDATIDLNPGTFSSVDGMVDNIGIADGVNINVVIGGAGNDVFILNNNLESVVTGGGGLDTFRASSYGWELSTITDLSLGDRINVTDGNAAFGYQWLGATLTFGNGDLGQQMTLSNSPAGHLVVSSDRSGGIDLTLANQDPGLNDFSGDGTSDILWQNTSGALVEWQMNDMSPVSSALIGSDPAWMPLEQGRGDFNGDHQSDILYRDSATGQVVEWDMNAGAPVSEGPIGGDLNWSVVGTGDFNGDGKTDILWQNTSGTLVEWQMNGRAVVSSAVIGLDPNWTVVGTGDFNGDGKTDILQRNVATGQVVEWDMNGSQVVSAGFIGGDLNWSVAGIGDFNGDGKSDILWRNTDGALAQWQMNDRTVIASAIIGLDPGWTVAGTGNFTDTGLSDILQRNTATGQVVQWDMHGTSVASAGLVGGDLSWHVATA